MAGEKKTTVIIVNWNGEAFLEPLLKSLEAANAAEIIVVDNDSTDSSREILAKHPELTMVLNEKNLGFGRAANQGIELSKSPFILLLNADIELTGEALKKLEDFLEENPETAVVAPQLLFADRSIQPSCRTFPTIGKCFLFLSYLDQLIPGSYRLPASEHLHTREVDQPMGAALLFRKSALDQVGTFDPDFFLYMEEVDLCERLKRSRWKIYLHPESRMIHHAGGSSRQDWERSQRHYLQSLVRYFQKRKGPIYVFFLKLSLIPALMIRSLVLLISGRFRHARFYLFAVMQLFRNP